MKESIRESRWCDQCFAETEHGFYLDVGRPKWRCLPCRRRYNARRRLEVGVTWLDPRLEIRFKKADQQLKDDRLRRLIDQRRINGIPEPEYESPGYCEISGEPADDLVPDHCHKTHRFRGWIRKRTNLGLGYFKDEPDLLRQAADYLERKLKRPKGD